MTGKFKRPIMDEEEFAVGSEIICINDHMMHDKINYLARYIVQSAEPDGQGRCSVKIISNVDNQFHWISTTRFMPSARYDRLQEVGHAEKETKVALDKVTQADVAAEASTHQSNVSAILLGKDRGYSKQLVERVKTAAEKLGYELPEAHGNRAPAQRTQADKADAGKISTLIFDQDFLEANVVVAQVFEYGAQKYSRESFYRIAFDDWEKAEGRHKRARVRKQAFDEESGLLHLAHEVANKTVMLQLAVKKMLEAGYSLDALCKFNPPPQDHKKNG